MRKDMLDVTDYVPEALLLLDRRQEAADRLGESVQRMLGSKGYGHASTYQPWHALMLVALGAIEVDELERRIDKAAGWTYEDKELVACVIEVDARLAELSTS